MDGAYFETANGYVLLVVQAETDQVEHRAKSEWTIGSVFGYLLVTLATDNPSHVASSRSERADATAP